MLVSAEKGQPFSKYQENEVNEMNEMNTKMPLQHLPQASKIGKGLSPLGETSGRERLVQAQWHQTNLIMSFSVFLGYFLEITCKNHGQNNRPKCW